MILDWFSTARRRARKSRRSAAEALYRSAVEQARSPDFYTAMRVPDTIEGRFDLLVLHVVLIIRRLGAAGEDGTALAQNLFDTMFDDMDKNLREIGVGDLSVGKKVKALATGFYGRAKAYEEALAGSDAALRGVVARNLYGSEEREDLPLDLTAAYVRAAARAVDGQPAAELLAGRVRFPAPEETGRS